MDNLTNIANRLIPAFTGKNVIEHQNGNTKDIISTINKNHSSAVKELKAFALAIPGNTDFEKCRNLWYFLFTNIRYKLDPYGIQLIKKPNALWHDKDGDCKSFALFICSCMENLNIPYNYKYVSFSPINKDVTHVYVEAFPGGKLTFMDVPLRKFNQQKQPFYNHIIITHKQMSEIHSVGNIGFIGQPYEKIIDFGPKDISQISEGEASLWLAKDRLQTERNIVAGIAGIGRIGKVEKYNDAIDVINDALGAIGRVPDSELEKEYQYIAYQSALGRYANAEVIGSIGSPSEKYNFRVGAMEQRADERAKWRAAGLVVPAEIGATKLATFLKTTAKKTTSVVKAVAKPVAKAVTTVAKPIAKAVKTVAKPVVKAVVKVATTVAKVVTLPERLLAKGILELTLPKASPFFLYLFLTDAQNKVAPQKVQAKRSKAKDVANFIVDFVGMKREHFMEICRNGIMKKYKKSPEAVLTEQMKAKKTVAGVGIIDDIISIVIEIINQITKLTKKKPASTVTTADTPTAEDWQGTTTAVQQTITTGLKNPATDFVTITPASTSTDTFTSNTKKATGICG